MSPILPPSSFPLPLPTPPRRICHKPCPADDLERDGEAVRVAVFLPEYLGLADGAFSRFEGEVEPGLLDGARAARSRGGRRDAR